jgi:hypothetical protein
MIFSAEIPLKLEDPDSKNSDKDLGAIVVSISEERHRNTRTTSYNSGFSRAALIANTETFAGAGAMVVFPNSNSRASDRLNGIVSKLHNLIDVVDRVARVFTLHCSS